MEALRHERNRDAITPSAALQAVRHLYAHVPFCAAKCQYCGFYSVTADADTRAAFAPLPGVELAALAGDNLHPATIYFGGGTPGLLGPDVLTALADALRPRLVLDRLEEWSVELNPAGVTPQLVAALRRIGVNRVSLGVQSCDDATLRRIGRLHDAAAGMRALQLLREGGCDRLGVDLIAGLPGVTADRWRETLLRTLGCGVAHISVYALSVEPATPLSRQVAGGLKLPDDEAQLEALAQAETLLTEAGLARYEISNYALPGQACRHNLACWRGADYLGLGPAAASRIGLWRWTNAPDLRRYMERVAHRAPPPRMIERLSADEDTTERFVFGLRLAEGVAPRAFATLHPAAAARLEAWERTLARLVAPGIVEQLPPRDGSPCWRLTARGREVADAVIRELL
jgi:oxygen-independent coproporphyrinogen-3 oxidase